MPKVMSAEERRAYMEEAIDRGGVVLYGGQTIGNKAHLPSLAELAETDEEVNQALIDLELRKKQLALDEQKLRARSASQPLGSTDNITTKQPQSGQQQSKDAEKDKSKATQGTQSGTQGTSTPGK